MSDHGEARAWIEPFSQREIEILRLISDGLTNYEISQQLMLSPETIKWYNKQIFSKLGVNNRTHAARKAIKYSIFDSQASESGGKRSKASHLPAQSTSFIGREREIVEVKRLLMSSRLVVLTGPGGCGKSRLAAQVAAELIEIYRDGVWLVELASIGEPALVTNAIAQALHLNSQAESSLAGVLKQFLARKQLLLLLDNFEHILEASPLAAELLAAAPQVTILATSRERLNLYGEREYLVHPLRLPDLQKGENGEQLLQNEAVRLFVQRARAARPGFSVIGAQAASVAQICVRLDGLPLAIELAASQVKIYPPAVLAQLLEAGLDALPSGPRDQPARQRTLHATIEWSYNLLNADEKILFARLAIFTGGSTLDGITRVCANGISTKVIKTLSALVEKSLVISRQNSQAELRFFMLETIHQYASECLKAGREAEDIRILQASYLTNLVETAQKEIYSARQEYWFGRLRDELDNLRSVLAWSLNGDSYAYGLRIAAALQEFWIWDGLSVEGRRWTDLALAQSSQAEPHLTAGVLRSAGHIALSMNDNDRSRALLSQAIELFRQNYDERNTAWALVLQGASYDGDLQEVNKGIHLCKQALVRFRDQADQPGLAFTLNVLGELARSQKDYNAAGRYYEESLSIAVEMGARHREAVLVNNLSFVAYHQGDYLLALQYAYQVLALARELNSEYRQACFITTVAGPAAALGHPELAAQLLGASFARYESLGIRHAPVDQSELDHFGMAIRHQLGDQAFQEAWQAGQALSLQDAVTLALSGLDHQL